MAFAEGRVGDINLAEGTPREMRLSRRGELVGVDAHGRFYEANRLASIYSGGIVAVTSISNSTFTVGGLGASTTPITGVWNPSTSPVNLVILQAFLQVTVTAATATGPAGFAWAASVGNTAISTGALPRNMKTLASVGSYAKDMSNQALTGVTNTPTVFRAAGVGGGTVGNFSQVGTAVGFVPSSFTAVENIDGGIIVPPGGLLVLLAGGTAVAHSAMSGIVWEEVVL